MTEKNTICEVPVKEEIAIYKNPLISVKERVEDLINRMTLEEKIAHFSVQILHNCQN